MGLSSDLLNAPREFLKFFKEGKEAAKQGNNSKAHDLFRQAIEIDPYHEQIWLWLASVVDSPEDQRVCFENVLELNPTNPTARRQIHKLNQQQLESIEVLDIPPIKRPLSRRRKLLRAVLMFAIVSGGVAAAVLWGVF